MKIVRKILSILSFLFLGIMVITVLFLFMQRVSGGNTTIFGYSVYRVSSGSMEPELSLGDVIVSDKVDASTIKKGDIITYQGIEGTYANKTITHRVIEVDNTEQGLFFVTKGDANPETDPIVSAGQVYGKMEFKVPIIGTLYSFFMTPYGLVAVILIILLAFSNEVITLFRLARDKVHRDVEKEFENKNALPSSEDEKESQEE